MTLLSIQWHATHWPYQQQQFSTEITFKVRVFEMKAVECRSLMTELVAIILTSRFTWIECTCTFSTLALYWSMLAFWMCFNDCTSFTVGCTRNTGIFNFLKQHRSMASYGQSQFYTCPEARYMTTSALIGCLNQMFSSVHWLPMSAIHSMRLKRWHTDLICIALL